MGVLFRFGPSPATGLPQIEDPEGQLTAAAREEWQRHLDRQFESLASGPDGQLVTLPENGAATRSFRVTVKQRHRRCPTLVFEEVEPEPDDGPGEGPEGRWQAEFVAGVADLAGSAPEGADLQFVVKDLRSLLRKDPQLLQLLLLAGYLHVGEALAQAHGEKGGRYAASARALAQLAEGRLPPGTLDPLLRAEQPAPAPSKSRGWLRRVFCW